MSVENKGNHVADRVDEEKWKFWATSTVAVAAVGCSHCKAGYRSFVSMKLFDCESNVSSFASRDSSLPHNTEEFSHACSWLFVAQAGDLGCFRCPSGAKPYISSTRYQKHLSKCRQPTGAIMGWDLNLNLNCATVKSFDIADCHWRIIIRASSCDALRCLR